MPSVPLPDNFISVIQDNRVRIEQVTPDLARQLALWDGVERPNYGPRVWELPAPDDIALGRLLEQLRDIGVLFAGPGPGWPPADVFEYLREKGIVHGTFQAVVWHRPGRWSVRTR